MAVISTYRTVQKRGEGLYKEKGSKFIGIAMRCYNEAEAKEFLESWKKEHHQARHLCYAYRFGLEGEIYRANDDGEPSNSAGAPILGQLQSFEITNVLVGVVRYYGGTKLGVGGLINAYRTAAKEAIESTEIITLEVFNHIVIKFDYPEMVSVMNALKKWNLEMDKHTFEESCEVEFSLPLSSVEEIVSEFESIENVELIDKGIY